LLVFQQNLCHFSLFTIHYSLFPFHYSLFTIMRRALLFSP
jgi:hypothetical protein